MDRDIIVRLADGKDERAAVNFHDVTFNCGAVTCGRDWTFADENEGAEFVRGLALRGIKFTCWSE